MSTLPAAEPIREVTLEQARRELPECFPQACTTHHPACDCREQKIAVLIKAAQDAACELDYTKNRVPALSDAESDRITAIVERVHNACEQLGDQGEVTWAQQLAAAGRQQAELQKRIHRLVAIAKTFRFRLGGSLWTLADDDRELAVSVDSAIAEAEGV